MYDINKTFEENIAFGPIANLNFPEVKSIKRKYSFLGHKLNSLFGVAASPLTHGSRAVSVCSRLGYDIITYRSVRSIEWHGQKYPHLLYASIPKQLLVEDLSKSFTASFKPFQKQAVSMANSFGIQSLKPEYWQSDFEIAKRLLLPNQLLILSLMFTPETGTDVVKDAATVAKYAEETSASVFEINLAHPNSGMKSLVFEDASVSLAICKQVKKILGDRPLLAKVGYYKNTRTLHEFMERSKGIIAGISSTNTYSVSITDTKNNLIFPGRPKAGISGNGLRTLSMNQAKKIVEFKKSLRLKNFVSIGIGGVIKTNHVKQYFDLGVNAVQAVVGIFVDPYLGIKYKNKYL